MEAAVADIVTSDRATGMKVSEHPQTKPSTVDYNEYPSITLVFVLPLLKQTWFSKNQSEA